MFYYIPFQIETYEAVTLENIKAHAKYTIEVTDGSTVSAFVGLLLAGDLGANWDGKRVRLLIELGERKKWIAVNADGNVFDGAARRTLGPLRMADLKAKLAGLLEQKNK